MPPNFGMLHELQVMILDNNRLTEFPNDRIDVMGSLQELSMHGNYSEIERTNMTEMTWLSESWYLMFLFDCWVF